MYTINPGQYTCDGTYSASMQKKSSNFINPLAILLALINVGNQLLALSVPWDHNGYPT